MGGDVMARGKDIEVYCEWNLKLRDVCLNDIRQVILLIKQSRSFSHYPFLSIVRDLMLAGF